MKDDKQTRTGKRESKEESILQRIPPNELESEQFVMGSILLDHKCLDKAKELLGSIGPEAFYNETLKLIYKCCLEMSEKGEYIDCLTVKQRLKEKGMGGVLADLIGGPVSIGEYRKEALEHHLTTLKKKYNSRVLSNVSLKIHQSATNDGANPEETIYEAIEVLTKLETQDKHKEDVETAQELLKANLPKKRYFIGGGLLPVEGISMIAGKPKLRKTTLALYECLCGATKTDLFLREGKDKTFIFPLDNGFTSLYIYSEGSRAFFKDVIKGQKEGLEQLIERKITDEEMGKIKLVRNRGMFLDTKEGKAKIRKLLKTNPSDVVVFDPVIRKVTGDLSDAKDVLRVISFLDSLGQEFGCAFLLVHHSRKGTGEKKSDDPQDEILGSGVWRMSYESCIMVLGRTSKQRSKLMQDLLFELRNEAEPMPLTVKFDPDTFIPRPLSDSEKVGEKAVTMEAVVEILKTEYNGSTRETIFKETLGERFAVSPQQIYNLLKEAQEVGLVTKERGRGKPWCIAEAGEELFKTKNEH